MHIGQGDTADERCCVGSEARQPPCRIAAGVVVAVAGPATGGIAPSATLVVHVVLLSVLVLHRALQELVRLRVDTHAELAELRDPTGRATRGGWRHWGTGRRFRWA